MPKALKRFTNVTKTTLASKTITKTSLYSFYPHLYSKTGNLQGYTLCFLILLKNVDCGYSLEPPRRVSNEHPQLMFWAEMWKISVFLSENFRFLEVKFSIYLNMRVFVITVVVIILIFSIVFTFSRRQIDDTFFLFSGYDVSYLLSALTFDANFLLKKNFAFNGKPNILEKKYFKVSFAEVLPRITRVDVRNGYVQCPKGNNSKSRQPRVMTYSTLHLLKVSWKYLEQFLTYRASTSTW